MATGDLTVFEEFSYYLGNSAFEFDGVDVIKVGIIDNTAAPTAADASPAWGDYSANAVDTDGGGTSTFTTAVTWTETGGVATLKATSFTIDKAAGADGSTTAWAIIYDDTNSADRAIAFIELGTIDITLSDVVIKFNNAASGELGNVLTVSVT